MPGPNDALAAVLGRGNPADEPDALLGALVDGGVYVPVDDQGSVVFIGLDPDSGPVLPGYTSEAVCAQLLPDAAGAVHCDALRLLDIAQHTGVGDLAVFAGADWARVPMPLVAATLRDRGVRTQGEQTLRLTWSTHPVALALRAAFAEQMLGHPAVHTAWIADARWLDTGNEHLMVHIAAESDAGARELFESVLRAVMAENLEPPALALRVLGPDETAELDRMGLDTVRADHAANRVHVISREFD